MQNFNENIGILLLLGAYALMVKYALGINLIVVVFGGFISLTMWLITRAYRAQQVSNTTTH